MSRMLTAFERQAAARDQELARRRTARLRRYLTRPDLGSTVREHVTAEIDDLERECAILGTLLAQRTGSTIARNASEHDSAEQRPYQTVAQ